MSRSFRGQFYARDVEKQVLFLSTAKVGNMEEERTALKEERSSRSEPIQV
jgi:hypothetical protein